jgi:phospholipid/cholesterol/gamma-HCH transport system substrate-binding protein
VRNAFQSTRVYGVVFLALCLLALWLTKAIFTNAFKEYDEVTLQSSNIGLSLPTRADVKIRGVIVGEVLEVDTSGDGAELTLGLYPDERDTIPEDVTARILPKTLFGEKYVLLEIPTDGGGEPIQAGATIEQSEVAVEVEAVINDLFPLLRTVQPAELNYTLTAIANTLEGRGEDIGASLETLDAYLKRMNPELPGLIRNITQLGEVSEVYESVVPDLARLLRNSVVVGNTFESREEQITTLFTDVAGFSTTAQAFLERNGDKMIRLADQGATILPLLARYSPEFRCFLRGAVESIAPNEEAFRNKTLHIILETLPNQPRGYNVNDLPRWEDNRGPFPYCGDMYAAINNKYNQKNLVPERLIPEIRDGVDYPLGKVSPDGRSSNRAPVGDAVRGTSAEQAMIDLAAAPVLGVQVEDVPDLATLLLGPIARGMEVDVR